MKKLMLVIPEETAAQIKIQADSCGLTVPMFIRSFLVQNFGQKKSDGQ